ncbi:hypothetical protein N303_04973, partial [Cuculus canorus]
CRGAGAPGVGAVRLRDVEALLDQWARGRTVANVTGRAAVIWVLGRKVAIPPALLRGQQGWWLMVAPIAVASAVSRPPEVPRWLRVPAVVREAGALAVLFSAWEGPFSLFHLIAEFGGWGYNPKVQHHLPVLLLILHAVAG